MHPVYFYECKCMTACTAWHSSIFSLWNDMICWSGPYSVQTRHSAVAFALDKHPKCLYVQMFGQFICYACTETCELWYAFPTKLMALEYPLCLGDICAESRSGVLGVKICPTGHCIII